MEGPRGFKYLHANLEMEEEDRFVEAFNSEVITLMSDGELKKNGGFGWVATIDEEVIASCYGRVKGS